MRTSIHEELADESPWMDVHDEDDFAISFNMISDPCGLCLVLLEKSFRSFKFEKQSEFTTMTERCKPRM